MNKPSVPIQLTLGFIPFAVVVYLIAGFIVIYRLPSVVLVNLALYPQDISLEWKLIPFVDRISVFVLKNRNLAAIKSDFAGLGYTLYSGALGYREVNSDLRKPRPQEEELYIQEITKMLHLKGVRVSNQFDQVGCTAVHQAILNGDVNAAKYLLALEGINDLMGKADAKYVACRQSASDLSRSRGIPLKN